MYQPAPFKLKDKALIERIIREHPFGILVSGLMATHLPFTLSIDEASGNWVLTGHIAKGNPQSKLLGQECLVIFQGPHAYISPSWYEKENSVPTWDYLAVHCYGIAQPVSPDEHFAVVEELIMANEPAFMEKWQQLPDHYRDGLSKGITGFRMIIDRMEASAKLSQNRTESERRNIILELSNSPHTSEQSLSAWIKEALEKSS